MADELVEYIRSELLLVLVLEEDKKKKIRSYYSGGIDGHPQGNYIMFGLVSDRD
jgi:hypothetical protein